MDRKSLLVLAISFLLLMLWYPLVDKMFPPPPRPQGALTSSGLTNEVDDAAGLTVSNRPPAELSSATESPLTLPVTPAFQEPEQTVSLETDQAVYVFTSRGGGLKHVELKHYREVVGRRARKSDEGDRPATLNEGTPFPIFAILSTDALPIDGTYELTRVGTGLRAETRLESGLHIIKEYLPDTNFLLKAAVRIENTSTQAIQLPSQEWVVGSATPISSHDDGRLMRMQWSDGNDDSRVDLAWFDNRTLGCFPGTPRPLYTGGESNVLWASAQNQFFTLIAIPPSNAPALQAVARRIPLPPPAEDVLLADRQVNAKPQAIQTGLVYPSLTLAPGEKLDRRFELFAGPKEYRTLDRLSARFENDVDRVMGFGGFFGFFAKALLLSMNGLHGMGLSYGLAIVVITIII